MAIRNEFPRRNVQAARFGNVDLVPSTCTLASRVLQNSPLKAAWQAGCRVRRTIADNFQKSRLALRLASSANRQHKQFCVVAAERLRQISHCRDENERGRIRRVKHWQVIVVTFAAVFASIALAEDFTTIDGKEYKDVTVSRVEPDGIVLTTKTGISKVYFVELPKEVQERFLPSTPKTNAAQRGVIKLKTWAATVKNPTSFVLLFIGVASLMAAGLFAIVRSRFQRQPTIKKHLIDRPGRARSRRL